MELREERIVMMGINDIHLDPKNPRRNEVAIGALMKSIEEFGFRNPIVIDKNGKIIAGNTRYKAACQLDMTEVPCIIADDLTAKELRAYQLADNKTAEIATWDAEKLNAEMEEIGQIFDMSNFGFGVQEEDMTEMPEVIGNDDDDYVCCPRCGREFPKVGNEA